MHDPILRFEIKSSKPACMDLISFCWTSIHLIFVSLFVWAWMILIGYLYIGRPAGTSKQYLFVLRKVNSHRKWFLCTIYPEQSRAELFEEIRKSEKEKIHLLIRQDCLRKLRTLKRIFSIKYICKVSADKATADNIQQSPHSAKYFWARAHTGHTAKKKTSNHKK